MNKFTKEMVNDYASKLLIGLTDEENKMVLEEFESIDSDIDLINKIDGIDKINPMTHALDDFVYELRSDEIEESIDLELLLKNCDDNDGQEPIVPKVVS